MIAPIKRVSVTAANLRKACTYLSPAGRFCRLVASDGQDFDFEYIGAKFRDPFDRAGFTLARSNLRLLSEVRG